MLLLISRLPHRERVIHGLDVSPVDENIAKLLTPTIVMNRDQAEIQALNIADYARTKMEEAKVKAEAAKAALLEWEKTILTTLTEEEQKAYHRGQEVSVEPPRIPPAAESIDGVLIAEDVPSYFVPALHSHFRALSVPIYHGCYYQRDYSFDQKNPREQSLIMPDGSTVTMTVGDTVSIPKGDPEYHIFRYY